MQQQKISCLFFRFFFFFSSFNSYINNNMASLRSFTSLARISARQNIRSSFNSNVRATAVRRGYSTAPPPSGGKGGFSPLLWIGNIQPIVHYLDLLTYF